jgi:outer membrane protein assembly factor BamA
LRQQFPLKIGDLFERGKVASGLENLRKLSGTHGFLDWTAVPETTFGSDATVNLKISIEEGPQYHMGKLETVGDKQLAAKLSADWNLAEGNVYDRTYIDQFLETNRDSLPVGFSRANVQTIQNCPDALVEVRLILDPAEETSHADPKNVPCEHHHDVSK